MNGAPDWVLAPSQEFQYPQGIGERRPGAEELERRSMIIDKPARKRSLSHQQLHGNLWSAVCETEHVD